MWGGGGQISLFTYSPLNMLIFLSRHFPTCTSLPLEFLTFSLSSDSQAYTFPDLVEEILYRKMGEGKKKSVGELLKGKMTYTIYMLTITTVKAVITP